MANLKVLIRDSATGNLTIGIPRPPVLISGIDLLVQIVALLFLNNGGRSIVSPGRAGGMRALMGSNIDPNDPSELFADVRLMTSQVEQLVKEEQVKTKRPPSERLQALRLIDIIPNLDSLAIQVVVSVSNEEQQQSQAVVVI